MWLAPTASRCWRAYICFLLFWYWQVKKPKLLEKTQLVRCTVRLFFVVNKKHKNLIFLPSVRITGISKWLSVLYYFPLMLWQCCWVTSALQKSYHLFPKVLFMKKYRIEMRLSFNFANVRTKPVNVYLTFPCTMAANCTNIEKAANCQHDRTKMVLRNDNSIIVSNGQQSPLTSALQPSITFIHPNIA